MRDLLRTDVHEDFQDGRVDTLLEYLSATVAEFDIAGKKSSLDVPQESSVVKYLNSYPNPFRNSTTIEFGLNQSAEVELVVYDVLGREVEQLVKAPLSDGHYRFSFYPHNLAPGLYFSQLRTGQLTKTGKMIYTK